MQLLREESQGDTGHLLEVSRDFLWIPIQGLVFQPPPSEGFLNDWELLGSPCSAWDTQRIDPALPFLQFIQPFGQSVGTSLSIVHKNESSYDLGLELNFKKKICMALRVFIQVFPKRLFSKGKRKQNVQISNIFQSLLSHASLYPLRHNFQ